MKRGKQLLCSVLAAALMIPLAAAAPGCDSKSLSDVQGHWAQKEIETAIATGWVDGYPDGTFRPEKTITRAEFTKMLLEAIHLTPDSELVTWMRDYAKEKVRNPSEFWLSYQKYMPKLYDMSDHWLTTQGWTDAALYSGMVVPSDYNGKNFRPEKEIVRYEIALMTDRALGLVYPASQYDGEALPFADNADILDWMKGYVSEAVKAGVLSGYPDNTFRPNKTSTRAEAVVMVQRMLDEMEQGLDNTPVETVRVQYRESEQFSFHQISDEVIEERETDQIRLQQVDHVIYASMKDLYTVLHQMMQENGNTSSLDYLWWPAEQKAEACTYQSNEWLYSFQMGNSTYAWGARTFNYPTAMRCLYGEVMIPVFDLDHPSNKPQEGWQAGWNAETKTLTIPMFYYGDWGMLS